MKCRKMMVILALLPLLFGIVAAAEKVDYSRSENWVVCDAERTDGDFDVFYIYPTLFSDKARMYMSWLDNPKLRSKTVGFVTAQTGIMGNRARIFAPYVRQTEYSHCYSMLSAADGGWRDNPKIERGVADTIDAFRYYLTHYNKNRPYILFGHSQGSTDLYEMMLLVPEVGIEGGLVAAYLPGLPIIGAERIAADFRGRGIRPAAGADDLGVIIGWNTQSTETVKSAFAVKGTYCINPLNWKTDAVPADKSLNRGAFFYDYRIKNPERRVRTEVDFCGAVVDPERGALIVDLPTGSEYDAHGFMGKGVFHMNDVWFFAGNIRENAALRVDLWRGKYRGEKK